MTNNRQRKSDRMAPRKRAPAPPPPTLPVPGFEPGALASIIGTALPKAEAASRCLASLRRSLEALAVPDVLQALATSDAAASVEAGGTHLRADLPSLLSDLERVAEQIAEWRRGERRSRRARFEEEAARRGWTLTGSWPEPVVQQIVFVAVDEAKDTAIINGKALPGVPAAERLLAAVIEELGTLERERTQPEVFAVELWKAYAAAGGEPGRGIPVFDVLRGLLWLRQSKRFHRDPRADTFRQYPVAQFRADLTHYLASGAPPFHEGGTRYQLEIAAGSFAQDGLFMFFPQTERLGTCGRLTFKPMQDGEAP
jgi:hypothetical protein